MSIIDPKPGWHELMDKRINGGEENVPWFVLDKVLCHSFAQSLGISMPALLQTSKVAKDLDFDALPDSFVLKPNLESSTRGVMVLRADGGEYTEQLRKRRLSREQIILEQQAFLNNIESPDKCLLVEEVVQDLQDRPIPVDFKFYMFGKKVGLVLEIDRNTVPSSVVWYDEKLELIDPESISLNPKYVQAGPGHPPKAVWEAMEVAKIVSAGLGTAFLSVDMYLSKNGPTLGEITLTPGGLFFGEHFVMSSELDEKLGQLWRQEYGCGTST